MFYALSAHPEYWKSKLNLFVALAPVSQMTHQTCELFKYGSKFINEIWLAFNTFHIYSIMDGCSAVVTKAVCGLIPGFCKVVEGFIATHDRTLDDDDRF